MSDLIIGSFVIIACAVIVLILGPLVGWLTGLATALFFNDSIHAVTGFYPPQLGATLGFILGFMTIPIIIIKVA